MLVVVFCRLFNWHLEKDVPVRQKRERIIIVKNLFDPNVFEVRSYVISIKMFIYFCKYLLFSKAKLSFECF